MTRRFTGSGTRVALALCTAGFALTLWSCYPGDGPTVSETDVVVTMFRNDARFSEYKRYWMPDSVFHLNNPDDPVGDNLSREFDELILRTVADNMEAIGYTRYTADVIDTTLLLQNADVVLAVSALATKNVVVGVSPPWWGGGGWGWGGCCYNPGYPPTYVAGTFTTGTVFLDMYDIQRIDQGSGTIPVPWSVSMNGVMNSSSDTGGRLVRAINQAYAQSDYLDGSGAAKGGSPR